MYIVDLFVPPERNDVKRLLAEKLDIDEDSLGHFKILKKSLDARNKADVHWVYRIEFDTAQFNKNFERYGVKKVEEEKKVSFEIRRCDKDITVIVVGMGPAGIFCALSLALSGIKCILFERGKRVEERVKDISLFFKHRLFNEESNIQFGEGGAGTFSDGKLTTRTRHPYYDFVIKEFISAGAHEEIAYLAKPHIGTDRLRKVLINLRKKLLSLGVEIHFQECIKDLILQGDTVRGVVTDRGEYLADYVVLAIGYSARDTLRMLVKKGLFLEAKGFAMGYRIELPQEMINEAMYGKFYKVLPPAEYFFTKYFPDRGLSVYTFCMCPGGVVMPACSSKDELVLNGMSRYKRDGYFGNSAIVVSYSPKVWHNECLGGLALQEKIERTAFLAGGGNFDAPALKVTDFIAKKVRPTPLTSSYPFGLKPYPIWEFYEEYYDLFKRALIAFGKHLKGILSSEALLIAPETRTSSPYRIKRDENLMSVSLKKLFPCGEGAGYAGGIMTSAIDGLKVAEKIKELAG